MAIVPSLFGCARPAPSAQPGDASSPPPAFAASASGAPTPVVPAKAVASSPPAPGSAELPRTLRDFFAGYKDGTDFEFMRLACRPTMDRFVTLRNVNVATTIREAKSFFHDKHGLAYRPDLGRVRTEPRSSDGGAGGGTTVSVPLTMSWTYPIPKEWDPSDAGSTWPAYPDAPHVDRSVTVDVEIDLDDDGRIARYVEAKVESPLLRVTGAEECDDADRGDQIPLPWLALKKGTLVHDLGETVIVGTNAKGPDVARKVRANERSGWTMESVAFAVPNPGGGTSAGGSSCLAPVGDAGAASK